MVSILSSLLGLALFATATSAADCTDVHVVFARGTGEMAGLGICGTPLVSDLKNNLSGMTVSSYGVNYLADYMQTSAGSGATDMTNHIVQIAKDCPNTSFVIGGYSQGASVTDIAIAVVTFGNPLKLSGQTIAQASSLYGSKSIDFCNTGDPVCANGFNGAAHLAYPTNGMVTKAAQQAAAKIKGGTSKSKNLRAVKTTTEPPLDDNSEENSNDSSDSNDSES
ncbi:cutinase [Thraustotheca clavata]|uniref:Cutinase n=1 Tax=Thraustotheca clavata TaxID=74557 RepID=A0A1V9Y7T5_9STRA|nr:cutinase [Thraustotheca clavata]